MASEINLNLINNLSLANVIPQNVVKLSEAFVPDILKLNNLVFVNKLLKLDGEKLLLFSDKGNFTLNKEFVPKAFESGKIIVNKIKTDFILKFIAEIKEKFKSIDFEKIKNKFTEVKVNIKNLFKVLDFNLKGENLTKTIDNLIADKSDFKLDIASTLKKLFSDKNFSKNLIKEIKEKLDIPEIKDEKVLNVKTKEGVQKLKEVLKLIKSQSPKVKVSGFKEFKEVKELKQVKEYQFKNIVSQQIKRLDYNKLTLALKDLNLEVKESEINLKSVLNEVSKKGLKEVSLLKFNELNFNKPSKSSLDSFNILKNILNLSSKSDSVVSLDVQVKEFFKEFEALVLQKDDKAIKNFKKEALVNSKEGSSKKDKPQELIQNVVKQVKNFEQIINGQEALDRLNPILAAKGEPILLLFPNLFRNFMSSIEVSYLPYFEEEIRDKNNKQRKKNKYTHLNVKVEFQKLGKVEVRIKYNSFNLFAEIVVKNQKVADFLEKRIGKFKRRIRSLIKLNIYAKVSIGTYSSNYDSLEGSNYLV